MRPNVTSQGPRNETIGGGQAGERTQRSTQVVATAPRPHGQLRLVLARLRMDLSLWRLRNQLGALPAPLCPDGCNGPGAG